MQMQRVMIQLPPLLKSKLDEMRAQGMTTSGFIRNLLAIHFSETHEDRKAR